MEHPSVSFGAGASPEHPEYFNAPVTHVEHAAEPASEPVSESKVVSEPLVPLKSPSQVFDAFVTLAVILGSGYIGWWLANN